jgi:hypothetical protein
MVKEKGHDSCFFLCHRSSMRKYSNRKGSEGQQKKKLVWKKEKKLVLANDKEQN